jgi:hypothetical protein
MALWIAIEPTRRSTRIVATLGMQQTLLKAHLAPQTQHPRALPTLLEALALWEGHQVHAALVAGGANGLSDTNIYPDCFAIDEPTPLYRLQWVDGRRPRMRERGELSGMGNFRDLQALLRREVAR